jgi:ribulose 1,5-bisphosphate carboxylase large subunit-like protein
MALESVRQVFEAKLEPFGQALDVIYAEGGLMAHHDGVNSAVKAFWAAAENVVKSLSADEKKELDAMHMRIMNLTFNARTNPEQIVGTKRYEALINAL